MVLQAIGGVGGIGVGVGATGSNGAEGTRWCLDFGSSVVAQQQQQMVDTRALSPGLCKSSCVFIICVVKSPACDIFSLVPLTQGELCVVSPHRHQQQQQGLADQAVTWAVQIFLSPMCVFEVFVLKSPVHKADIL